MNIVIKAPLMADKIKELLDSNTFDGARFTFVEKKGMEMTFSVHADNVEAMDATAIAKNAIISHV